MKNLLLNNTHFSPSFYFSIILIFAIPGLGQAAIITWDGSSSTEWAMATNWDYNCVATTADDVTIHDVANDPVISAGTDAYANLLTLELGGRLDGGGGCCAEKEQSLILYTGLT